MIPKKMKRIDCRRCIHYFVTWVPSAPHGCKVMGFKSHRLPSVVVYQNSGDLCRAYRPKHSDDPSKIRE
jgi:hypothetical protein